MNGDHTKKTQTGLVIGGLIGAILGAGVAYLLMTAPSDPDEDTPLTGGELLSLTSASAILIRKIDDFRRRL